MRTGQGIALVEFFDDVLEDAVFNFCLGGGFCDFYFKVSAASSPSTVACARVLDVLDSRELKLSMR